MTAAPTITPSCPWKGTIGAKQHSERLSRTARVGRAFWYQIASAVEHLQLWRHRFLPRRICTHVIVCWFLFPFISPTERFAAANPNVDSTVASIGPTLDVDEPGTDRWSFGLIPMAPRMFFDGKFGRDDNDGSEHTHHSGILAAGLLVQWEWAQPRRLQLGLEGALIFVGGVMDQVLDDRSERGAPAMYARLGGTVRWPFAIIEDRWIFHLGVGAGILVFVIPSAGDVPTFGGMGIALTLLSMGFEWPIDDSSWSIGLQLEVLEVGVGFPFNGASEYGPIGSAYMLYALGQTAIGVHIRW